MYKLQETRTFSERLYNLNVLPDGNVRSPEYIDVIKLKFDNAVDDLKEESST